MKRRNFPSRTGACAMTALLSIVCAAIPSYGCQDTASRPYLHPTCNSSADDYAPSRDRVTGQWLFTSERTGRAAIYLCSLDGTVKPLAGSFSGQDRAGGFVSLTTTGDGVGITYLPGERQAFASVVGVTRTEQGIDRGQPLNGVNGPFFVSHVSIAPDGSRLMMVSDREGGLGGLDLWMLERRLDGTWSEPVHAGEAVNTPGDDITPVLMSADTLLFASNGMGGSGGLDIFMSVFAGGRWTDPIPMESLNSEYDDSDAYMHTDGTFCFASSRPGGRGGLDIWLLKP